MPQKQARFCYNFVGFLRNNQRGRILMKKKTVIALAVAAGLFLCIIIMAISAANNPKRLVADALANTANDVNGMYLVDYANRLVNGGSVTVTGSLKPLKGTDADAELKVYTDFSRMRFATSGKIKEGKTVKVDMRSAFDGNNISIECPQIVKKPYGVSLKQLPSNLPKSIFNPERDGDKVKLNKNFYEYLTRLYKTVSNDKTLANEAKRLKRDYQKRIVTALMNNARISKSSEKISVSGQQLSCSVVTLDFDRKTLADAVSEFVTAAKHDKNLESFLLKCYSNYDFGIKDADDMVDDFYARLDRLKRAVKDYDGDLTIWFYITKSGKRIARINIDTDGKNYDGKRVSYEMSLELGKNVKTAEEISFEFDSSEGDSFDITYSVRQNDRKAYKASVAVKYDFAHGRDGSCGIAFKWDKKSGGYTLSLDRRNKITGIEGKLTTRGDAYTFSIENIDTSRGSVKDSYGNKISEYGIKVTFDKTDRAFNPSRFTDVTKLSYEDYQTLKSDYKKGIADIKSAWFKKQ